MPIALRSTSFAFVLALTALTSASAQVTIEADQPAYEVSQLLTVNISGPPGAPTFLLVDVLPGPVVFPIGTIHIGFSPLWFVVNLGLMPATGTMTVHEAFSCRTTLTYGTEVYLQAICAVGGAKQLSNGLHFAEMGGDCTDECTGGVKEIGFQVTLVDVPQTGNLYIRASTASGASFTYGKLDIPLDLATAATGILAPPISNSNGSVVVSMLEWDGSNLVVRFFIDATASGQAKFGPDTYFKIEFGRLEEKVEIQTSCSQPLFVGQTYGALTVIKLIDVQ